MPEQKRILWVVEDSAAWHTLASSLPGGSEWEIHWAAGLPEGLRRAGERPCLAVLVDLACGGVEGLRQLRAAAPGAALLALLPCTDEALEQAVDQAGADDCLELPGLTGHALARGVRRAAENRRRLDALAASQAQFRLTLSRSRDALLVTDPAGAISYANPAAEALLGLSDAQLIGRDLPLGDGHLLEVPLAGAPFARRGVVELGLQPVDWQGQPACLVTLLRVGSGKTEEEALLDSEMRYVKLFQHMLDGFAYCRMFYQEGKPVDFAYLQVNDAFERLTGLRGAVGRRVSELIPGLRESNPELFEIYGRVALGGQPERFEMYLPPLEGWFSVSVYCPRREYFAAVFEVVTERKNAELALRASEQRYRLMYENIGEAFIIGDPNGAILSANPAAERMFGCSEDDLCRLGSPLFFDPNDPRMLPALEECRRSGRFSGELRFLRANGEAFPAEITSVLFQDDSGALRTTILVRDISERVRAEQSMRETEEFYRSIIQTSPDGISVVDLQGRVSFISDTILKLMRLGGREDALGRSALEFVAPQDRERISAHLLNLYQGIYTSDNQFRLLRKDGTDFEGEVTAKVLRGTDGLPRGIVAITRDVSERSRARAELELSNNLLRLTGEMARVGGWEFDAKTLVGTWTDEVARIHDMDLTQSTNVEVGMGFYAKPSRDAMERAIRAAVEQGEPYDLELEMAGDQGRTKWVRTKGLPVWQDGRVVKVHGIFQDITAAVEDRRRIEAANAELRASEERFRVLFNNRHSPMVLIDPANGAICDANPAACQFYGWTHAELLGMKASDLSTNLAEVIHARLDEALAVSTSVQYFARHRLANGDLRDMEIHSGPIQIGEKTFVLSILYDTTERKRTEQALRESEQHLRSILQTALDGFWILSMSGELLEVNEAYCLLSGYSRAELLRMRVSDLEALETPAETAEHILRVRAEGGGRFESKHRRKDGSLIDVEVSVKYIPEPQEQIICFCRDISERKRAERELRENRENLRALLNAISESVLLLYPDGQVVVANQTVAQRLGASQEQLVGHNIFGALEEETARSRRHFMDEVVRSGLRVTFEDKRLGRTILNAVAPIFGSDGQVARLAVVGFDITERKLAEEKLRSSLAEKETLLREVHHRVKNNLQAIIAMLSMKGSQIEDGQVRGFLKDLEGQARTMALVYEQLFSSDSLARVAMAAYLRRLVENILETYGRSNEVRLQFDLETVSMDMTQAMPCGLIVNELVTNMLKYAFPPGFEGSPFIRISPSRLNEAGTERQTYRLEVADNGVGLGPDWANRPNRGLGMQLVRLWVTHQLGGSLDMSSQAGLQYVIIFTEESG